MMPQRSPRCVAAATVLLLLTLPLASCDREDQAEVDEKLKEVEEDVERAWEKAEPEVREGVRDAGEAVGKGLEAAGELIQRGGAELQEEARDTSASTLPDTVSRDKGGPGRLRN